LSQAIANGGAAGYGRTIFGALVYGGTASAVASAGSTGSGPVQADASAFGGAGYSYNPGLAGAASVSASAQNHSGEVMTAASDPGAGPRGTSALSNAAIGPGSESLIPNGTADAVSNAILTPEGPDIGVGAMSAAYGGRWGPVQYEATAVFDFTSTKSEPLVLNLLADNVAGTGFDITLEVFAKATSSTPTFSHTFTSLTGSDGAESFFASHALLLGSLAAGSHSVKLEYLLNYLDAPYSLSDGFGFTYDLATAPVVAAPTTAAFDFSTSPTVTIPEPSTWVMLLVGFAGLAFAGYRASGGTRGRHGRPTFGRHFRWAI
jgi:hypothetical protein